MLSVIAAPLLRPLKLQQSFITTADLKSWLAKENKETKIKNLSCCDGGEVKHENMDFYGKLATIRNT